MSHLPDEQGTVEHFKNLKLSPGVYGFPDMPADLAKRPPEEQEKLWSEANARYKEGPSAWIIVAPAGQEMMDTSVLMKEFASDVVLGLIMAFIVSLIPGGFLMRFGVAILMGFSHWLSVTYSYFIWYRYPWNWIQDELFCSLFEAALAGLVIAAIVRHSTSPAPGSGT